MPELEYPNSRSLDGPWLIDSNALMQLNEILEESWERIGKDVPQETIGGYLRRGKRVKTLLKSGKALTTTSIEDAINEKSLLDELPTSMQINLNSGSIEMDLRIGQSENELSYSVSPINDKEASRIFISIERWVKSISPNIAIKLWTKSTLGIWTFAVTVFLALMVLITADPKEFDIAKEFLNQSAHKILENGIDDSELNEAIELILSYDAKYTPKNLESDFDSKLKAKKMSYRRFLYFNLAIFIIALVSSIKPKVHIGIGKGDDRIIFWRRWIRTVYFVIPGIVFTGIILPYIYDKLKLFF